MNRTSCRIKYQKYLREEEIDQFCSKCAIKVTLDSDFRLTKCRREEKAALSSSNLQQEDGDQVIPDDFGDFLGNTTYLPGLPITNIIKID